MKSKLIVLWGLLFSGTLALNIATLWSQDAREQDTKGIEREKSQTQHDKSGGQPGGRSGQATGAQKSGQSSPGADVQGAKGDLRSDPAKIEREESQTQHDKSGGQPGGRSGQAAGAQKSRQLSPDASVQGTKGKFPSDPGKVERESAQTQHDTPGGQPLPSKGMSGRWSKENIKEVQEALKNKGHDPGPIDGVLGAQTQQALRSFQTASGLQATGRLDDQTANALGISAGSSSMAPSHGSSGSGPRSAAGSAGTSSSK